MNNKSTRLPFFFFFVLKSWRDPAAGPQWTPVFLASCPCHSRGITGTPCSREDVSHTATRSGHRWCFKLVILAKLKRLPGVCTYIVTEGDAFNYQMCRPIKENVRERDGLCAHAEECTILCFVGRTSTYCMIPKAVSHARARTHAPESHRSCDLPKGMTQECSSHKDVV